MKRLKHSFLIRALAFFIKAHASGQDTSVHRGAEKSQQHEEKFS